MEYLSKQDDKIVIAHWTYSREEWKAFQRWKQLRKGFFHYLLHRITPAGARKTPEIRISHGQVSINNEHERFHEGDRRFRDIHIRDAGKLNVMEICYEYPEGNNEIRIPIPRGKLREAMEVQDQLLKAKLSIV